MSEVARGTVTCYAPRILYEQAVSFTDARLSARSWHRCLGGLWTSVPARHFVTVPVLRRGAAAGQRVLRQGFPRIFDLGIDKREETARR